ncbi:MAG: TetR/AcrR family transcriptional regulator [Thermodesulfobacteriota bacterium]
MPKSREKELEEKKEVLSKSALRRQREREQRYQSILSAAETLFAREGYHKTSMERIADAAEVSVGAVYFYFKNKEDLLVQLLDEIGFRLRALLGDEFKKSGASLAGFRQAGRMFFEEFCARYPEKVAIVFRESVGQSPVVEARRKEIFDKLTGDVLNALRKMSGSQGANFRSRFSAEVIAVSIMGIYERVAYEYLFWQDRSKDFTAIGMDAVAFIVGGINNLFGETPCT